MVFKTLSTQEIISIIKSLKAKDSFGYEVSPRLLKICAGYISSPLTHICNKAISTGILPDCLKYSIIKPLYKKGDRSDLANYRPILMLTSFSKVLEKALYKRLIEHIDNKNILNDHQFGFRKRFSTEDAIFKLIYKIFNALNNKVIVGSIFCDLEKAFDSVNHSLFIKKLPYYGIMGKAKLLIESYLSNRYQRVQLTNSMLNCTAVLGWTEVKHGVPQGSVLGPLLFLLYINDLPKAVSNNVFPILFADDTSVLITSHNVSKFQNGITISLHQLSEWFQANSLSLNFSKTLTLQFITKSPNYFDINTTHGNNHISKANHIKFLGLYINDTLTWNTHIDNILPKLCSACFAMRSVKPSLSQQMLKAIYYSYFHSIMSYGIIFWGQSTNSIQVFRLQKKILRIMMGCKNRDSCTKLFISLKILPLPSQYIFCLLLFVVKNREMFSTNEEIHPFGTRQHHNMHQPSANLTKYQTGVYYMGIKLYNRFPAFLKHVSNNYNKFVPLLKKFLCENSFYSLEEFYSFHKPR